ncbi:MAG TPA: beta-propeller fold lactonase family protein, partial [Casimicrobiaceae bacterium]|nr:beta-propeller fold lactonase family protein [Casimicrobiaceae bacterium]
MNAIWFSSLSQVMIVGCSALALANWTYADTNAPLPTGQYVTPLAPAGAVQQYLNPGLAAHPNFVAGEAVRARLSPDGRTLAILCAGQNTLYDSSGNVDTPNSTQYVFLYDVAGNHKGKPALKQVIQQSNAHVGLVWAPNGTTFYAAGGNDDAVYAYTKGGGAWVQSAKIALGHSATHENKGLGLSVQPNAAGLAISADGKTLVVANNYNDSISVIDTATKTIRYEHDLRPYFENNEGTSGEAGGSYPFTVVVKGNSTAYVSANRDREVVVVDISSPTAGRLIKRIKVAGNPLGMTLDASQKTLYVAQDNADQVAVINTANNEIVDRIDTRAPQSLLENDLDPVANRPRYTGASPIAVTISPDGQTLYAVNDGANSVAVIPLRGGRANKVTALIPTAYAPKDITFSADGKWMYIINGKSETGPNPGHLSGTTIRLTSSTYLNGAITTAAGTRIAPIEVSNDPLRNGCDAKCQADNAVAARAARTSNQYQFQLERASLVSAPVPGQRELERLTRQVAENNFYDQKDQGQDAMVMRFLHDKIKHVIYVVKENRTFDQILGDLSNGSNGDSSLTMFGKAITPNHHNLAKNFVTLDNFMDPGDGSMDGWSWSMAGRVTSTEAITQQINYAGVNRGLSYESEGTNRNVPVGLDTTAKRDAATKGAFSAGSSGLMGGTANLLVGTANHAVTDAPFGTQKGYIFDAVLEADLAVRNYGFLVSNIGEPVSDPFAADVVQVAVLTPSLVGLTDLYFRGYDQNYPDLWRYNEWKREFDQYVASGNLPSLTLFRVSHDHMGNFDTALAGVNTPETQQA